MNDNVKSRNLNRAFILVLDGFGIGPAPDADKFNDEGSDTLGHLAAARLVPALWMVGLWLLVLTPIASLAPRNVIYVSTLSKVFAPACSCLGYSSTVNSGAGAR